MHDATTTDTPLLARLADLERLAAPLDPRDGDRAALRDDVEQLVTRYLSTIDARKGFESHADGGVGVLEAPIRDEPRAFEEVLRILDESVLRPGGNPASPGYLAYIPGSGLYHSALADYVAAIANKYAGVFVVAPGAVRMEHLLVRWIAELFGMPATAGGHLASGGSIAALTAIVTARESHGLRAAGYARHVVYLTAQAHHSIAKALRIAGLGEVVVRQVAMDERFRMRPDALRTAIDADRASGLTPWLVCATAGTTDTGAVDPLDAIADVARDAGCWYHVDAAYGGFFMLTEHGRALMQGIGRADSVIVDPHKGLFLPFGTGAVVFRDATRAQDALAMHAHYLQDIEQDPDTLSPSDVSPELTKHWRALRMWLPLVSLGTRPFAAALEEKLLLTRWFYDEVQQLGYEVGPEPELSIAIFRKTAATLEEANALNLALVERLRDDGRVFISSTTIDGVVWLRMAILSFRSHRAIVETALELLGHGPGALGHR